MTASAPRHGSPAGRALAHVPAKWTPVRRQGHAPKRESRARPGSAGTGCALAAAAIAAIFLGGAAAQTPGPPPATSEAQDAGVDAGVLRRVARVTAAEPGDGRVEQASGFVIDRYDRLVLTSCRVLFAERGTLAIEVEFAETPPVRRTADLLLCNRGLDLAVVRVRGFDIEFPRSLDPPPRQRIWTGDPLYVLGFAGRTPTVIPVIVDVIDSELPGVPGRFIGTRTKLPAPGSEGALPNPAELGGGPLVTAQGNLVGVNAFSSGERIRYAPSGVELTTVPKGTYFARTVDTIAPVARQALGMRP
jgi:S1-C subfamily serine protease